MSRARAASFVVMVAMSIAAAFAERLPDEVVVGALRWTVEPVIDSSEATSGTEAPPAPDAAWRAGTLPIRWFAERDGMLNRVWFSVTFERPAGDRPLAVYVRMLGNGGAFDLNGRRIGTIPTNDHRVRVGWFQPALIELPPDALRPGINTLLIRQQSWARTNVLRSIVIGPLDVLAARQRAMRFWQHTTALLAIAACGLFGPFMISIWARARSETLFAVFGVACLLWATRSAWFVVEVVPVDAWVAWRALYYASTGGFIAAMAIGLSWFAGRRPAALIPIACGYAALGPLVFLALGEPARTWLDRVWILGFLPFTIYAVVVLVQAWRRGRQRAHAALLASIVAAAAIALHDYLIELDPTLLGGSTFYGLHLAAPIVLASLGMHLVDRFARSLRETEALAHALEARVAERELALAANLERLHALERDQARAEERQRIMRELHDGVGSQLLSSLAMVERGAATRDDVVRLLRECLDDMRLAIDALTPDDSDLGGALGSLRYRLAPRLDAVGIRNRWHLQALPDLLPVSPHDSLSLLRIVQEALTNVIKHADARCVEVTACVERDELVLVVADDGVGFDASSARAGRGLRNMARRAGTAGAALNVESSPGRGTTVQVRRRLAAEAAVDSVAHEP